MRNTLFLGGGNMAYAILGGLLAKPEVQAHTFHVVEINPDARKNLEKLGLSCSETWPSNFSPEQIVIAVKPQILAQVLSQHQNALQGKLLVSIAAGVDVLNIRQAAGDHEARVARTMPNTPALVGEGLTGLYFTDNCSAQDEKEVETIFSACGQTLKLDAEADINRITAISGSGPGYVFYLMESLEQAAFELGFEPKQARALVNQTFLGAATLANQSGDELSTLREKVTSKGGTTHAGLEALRAGSVDSHIVKAAQAAKARAEAMQRGE